MKTFKRRSLPESIKYNGKVWKYGSKEVSPTIRVEVLTKKGRRAVDLHGKQYLPRRHYFNPVLTFSTLAEVHKAVDDKFPPVQGILNGRLYINNEWASFTITDELRAEIADKVSNHLGGRKKTRERIAWRIRNERFQHWGLGRFCLANYGSGVILEYTVGQWGQVIEFQQIRKELNT